MAADEVDKIIGLEKRVADLEMLIYHMHVALVAKGILRHGWGQDMELFYQRVETLHMLEGEWRLK